MARKREGPIKRLGGGKRPRTKKVLTVDEMLKHLQKTARRTKLDHRLRISRQSMQIEMEGLIVDALNLPKTTKTRLQALLAKRIRIMETQKRFAEGLPIDVNQALTILRDEKKQIIYHKRVLMGKPPPDKMARIHANIREQIAILEAFKARGILGVTPNQLEPLGKLLTGPVVHNALLIEHYLGPEFDKFHQLRHELMKRFLNRRF